MPMAMAMGLALALGLSLGLALGLGLAWGWAWLGPLAQASKFVKIHGSKLLLLSLRDGSKTIFVVAIF